MKVSLYLQMLTPEFETAAAMKSMVQSAERAGFDACNLTDHPTPTAKWRSAGGHDSYDPFAGLAFAAAVTSRIRLHTHIVVLPYRNPFITAKAAATVDVLSEGRLILGVASGYQRGEYEALGVDFASRGAIMDEALRVMKMAWSDSPVNYQGKGFVAADNLPRPLPVQKPHPPIWGGGNGEAAIRRAAELCDGWSPFFASPDMAKRALTEELVTLDDLQAKIQIVKRYLDKFHRERPFDICGSLPDQVSAYTASEAQRVIDNVGKLEAMGVNWIVVSVLPATLKGSLDGIQWYGEEVLPKIRG